MAPKGLSSLLEIQVPQQGGRPRIDPELRKLIANMWELNPTWGKPRIQAELAKLGISVSDTTVLKYKPKTKRPPSQSWRTGLDPFP